MAEPRESIKLKAIGLAYRIGWLLIRIIPERLAYRIADAGAAWWWKRGGRRRARVLSNLEPVLAPGVNLEDAGRQAFRNYARYWVETFRMQDLSRAELDARFSTENFQVIKNAYDAGTGAVLATMHLGNWDSGGRWVAERWPLTVVVEVLRPRKLFDRFVAHRRSLGMTIVPLTKGGDAVAACIRDLEAGKLIALVADRDLSGRGVEVKMFGRRTKLPPGPAVLSLRTGAPLIPAVVYMLPDGKWKAFVLDPIEPIGVADMSTAIIETTNRLAESFEQLVRRDPTQWHAMFLRYWIDE